MSVLLVFFWCAVCAGQTTTSAVPEISTISKPDSRRVAEILGVKQTKDDMRPALAAALASFSNANAEVQEKAIHALVADVNAGIDRAMFGGTYYKMLEMKEDPFAFARDTLKWNLGTFGDRIQLIHFIWKRALLLEKSSPDEAASCARAAMLLAANVDWVASASGFWLLSHNLDAFGRIAKTSAEQNRLLAGFFDEYLRYSNKHGDILSAIISVSKRIATIKPGDPIPPELTTEMIRILGQSRRLEAKSGLGGKYDLIQEAWLFRNAAKKRGDEKSVAQVDALLGKWKAEEAKEAPETDKQIVTGWIDQALSRVGPVRPAAPIFQQTVETH